MKLAARFIATSAVCIVFSACEAPQTPTALPSEAPSTDKTATTNGMAFGNFSRLNGSLRSS